MLTIFYYHEVVPNGRGFSYQKIDMDRFEMQMKYLHDYGYRTIKFSEISSGIPEKAVIVSFDDGFRTVYENAAPIMKKYNIKVNVYLPTAYTGTKPQFMDWDMVRSLREDFEFQAHTHNHLDIRTLSEEQLQREIQLSDKLMKEKLGYLPEAFCMPFGVFDWKSVQLIKKQNRYRYLLGSYYGTIRGSDLSRVMPRIGVSNDDTMETFERKLQGKMNWKGPMQRIRLTLQNIRREKITTYHYD